VIHQPSARCRGQVLGTKSDEPASRNPVVDTYPSLAVRDDRLYFAFAIREPGHHGTLVGFLKIDGELFPGLGTHAILFVQDDLRPRYGQLEAFAAHILDKHGQVQFAAP
jgi:hypothetical protein